MARTDALGHTTRTAWDPQTGRLPLSVTDPLGHTTRYAYDDSGNLTSVTDARGHTTHVVCDEVGLPVEVTDALGHTTTVRRGTHGRITGSLRFHFRRGGAELR